jgi:hypothetical protein
MKTFTYPSSDGTRNYTAVLADDGKLLCNCKGWTVRRGEQARHCKHTKLVANGHPVVTRGEFVFLEFNPSPDWTTFRQAPDWIPPIVLGGPGENTADDELPTRPPAPMLASAMTDPVTGAAFDRRFATGWVMEEKLDGHRCTVVVDEDDSVRAYSRPRAGGTGAKLRDLPAAIVAQFVTMGWGIYDGELVAPSGKAWDVVVKGAHLVFVAFDILACNGVSVTNVNYQTRRYLLLEKLRRLPDGQQSISTVLSDPPSWTGVQAIWARGGEGVIVKRADSLYRPGARSLDWLKVKQHAAATLTIVGYQAGKLGPYASIVLRDKQGIETTVKTLDNALLRDLAANPQAFIGRRVVISFQEKTPAGTYRHPMFDHFATKGE